MRNFNDFVYVFYVWAERKSTSIEFLILDKIFKILIKCLKWVDFLWFLPGLIPSFSCRFLTFPFPFDFSVRPATSTADLRRVLVDGKLDRSLQLVN